MSGATLFSTRHRLAQTTTVAWLLCTAAVGAAIPAHADPVGPGPDCAQTPFDQQCPITNPADPRCVTTATVSAVCPDHDRPPNRLPPNNSGNNNVIHPTGPADPWCVGNPVGSCVGGPYDPIKQPTQPATPPTQPPQGGEPPTGKPKPGDQPPGDHPPAGPPPPGSPPGAPAGPPPAGSPPGGGFGSPGGGLSGGSHSSGGSSSSGGSHK